MRSRLGLALAAAALAGSAPTAARAQEGAMWLFGEVSFPARVNAFQALGAERWPEAERGTVLRYGSSLFPGATFDVQVQPLPGGRSDPGAVREELRRTLDELRRYGTTGGGAGTISVDTVRAVSVQAEGWTYDGHVVEATVRSGTTTGRTLAYVFAKPPSLVKVRITHEPGQRNALEPRAEEFLRGLLGRLESFQDAREPGGP